MRLAQEATAGSARRRSGSPLALASSAVRPTLADLREGVDAVGNRRVELVRVAQRVLDRDDAVGRGRVGQQAAAVGVADAVDSPCTGVSMRSFTRTKPRSVVRPTLSSPRSAVFGRRPVATRTRSASMVWPLPSVALAMPSCDGQVLDLDAGEDLDAALA